MADKDRFGRSEREYTGVTNRTGDNRRRFGRSEREYTGVTNRTGDNRRRFGPSEKRYTEARYTPMGEGTTWGYTGDFRRKIPGYDVGARPPRGLASLIASQGFIGQDPRSTTYGSPWDYWQVDPDDLRGYRASVADVAAANAAEEQERIARQTAGEFLPAPTIPYQYRGRYETPGEIGEGYGMLGAEAAAIADVPKRFFGGQDTTRGDPAYAIGLDAFNKYNMYNPRQEGLDYTPPKINPRTRWDNPIGDFFRKFNPTYEFLSEPGWNRGGIASLRR